jgi:uncharacterized protein YbaR (Trm112 family)
MFIELTDHLRCPAPHEEAFLVLVPDQVRQRDVTSGTLGCLVCGSEYRIEGGIARLATPPFTAAADRGTDAAALQALLGLDGPGGYVALVGGIAAAAATGEGFDGIGLVLVNPSADVVAVPPRMSVLEAAGIPLKSRSVRGVVLGTETAADPGWIAEARRVLLPGRRLVAHGPMPEAALGLEVLASADGWWVAV